MNTNHTITECIDLNSIPAEHTNKDISEKIKFASFLMTCFVVCYHCRGFDNSYALGSWDSLLNEQIQDSIEKAGGIAMSYFFTVTGYLLFQGFSLRAYPRKMRRRVFSLLVPYLLWQCLYFATKVIFLRHDFPLSQFLKYTFCLEKWPLNGALWYVYAVFLLAIASPILSVFFKNKRTGWTATVLLILFLRYLRITANPSIAAVISHGYVSNILYYLPFYLIGCYLGQFSKENTKNDVFICIFGILLISYLFDDLFPNFFIQTAIGVMPLMGLYALPLIPALQKKKIYKLTFLMYAIHQPLLLNLEGYLWSGFFLEMPMPVFVRSILVRTIALSLDIGLAFLIHTVLKRYSPKLLAAITGGRAS